MNLTIIGLILIITGSVMYVNKDETPGYQIHTQYYNSK